MSSIIGGNVGVINISGGKFVAISGHEAGIHRFILENIAAKAIHDANNTDFELPKCYPGTRQAIQRDLTKWVEAMDRKYPICWLYAPAGSGKTAIAKTLADSFCNSPNPCLLASFFFRRTSPYQNTERFIATIAHQIKINLPQTSRFIVGAVKADEAIFLKDLRVQMDKLILKPLSEACKASSAAERASWPRLLVIDGLDECSGQGAQRKILDVVSHLVLHLFEFPLAVFLSCRPEAHIRGAFQGEHLNSVSRKICLPDTYSSGDDLRKLFVGSFQEVVNAHSHILEFPRGWPGTEIISELIDKSSGQFIYASTVMKYIDVQDDNPMERLDIVRGLEKSPDDENPFAELDMLYRHILASVKPKHLPTVIRVLQVTLSQSDEHDPPLSPEHGKLEQNLASFLGLKRGELEYSLGNLEGILVGTKESTRTPSVKFHHASFSDFLLDESRSGPYFIDISLAHTQFIIYLFRYILHVDVPSNTELSALYYHLQVPSAIVSIRFVLGHLPFATLTEEIRRILNETTTWKIIRLCIAHPDFYNPTGWELVDLFAAVLGRLLFNDAETLERNFLHEVEKFVIQELRKYAEEPLCHLVHMFLAYYSIPPPLISRNFVPFFQSIFLLDHHALQSDRSSLNLAHPLFSGCPSGFLRQIMKEIDYDFKPEAYSATCLCLLKCITDLSPLTISPSNALGFQLRNFFCFFGEPLLEKAGPSMKLQKCLEEDERVIYFFSLMDLDDRGQKMWKAVKAAIDAYLLRRQVTSSASGHGLEEPSLALFPLSSSRHTNPYYLNPHNVRMADPADARPYLLRSLTHNRINGSVPFIEDWDANAHFSPSRLQNPSGGLVRNPYAVAYPTYLESPFTCRDKKREWETLSGSGTEDAGEGTKRLKSD